MVRYCLMGTEFLIGIDGDKILETDSGDGCITL